MNENRINSELSEFAARLRDRIRLDFSIDSGGLADGFDFNSFALELFRLQFEFNSPYRRLCEARNAIPGRVSRWSQVPVVPTSAFKDFEFSCLAPEDRTRVFHSSGTTTHRPSRHFHSAESIALYEESAWTWFHRRVVASLESPSTDFTWAILTPPSNLVPHSSLVHMFETIRRCVEAPESCFTGRAGHDGSWTLDVDRTFSILREVIHAGRPVILLGTAFLMVHLLDELIRRNLRLKLPAGSRIFETGGYKGRSRAVPKSELRRLFRTQLGIPESNIISEYGMSELSSQAYVVPTRNTPAWRPGVEGVLQFPPWVRWKITSPEDGRESGPGETGLLRVYDLANVFSVIAIQTEDLAVRRENGFELIGRAEGSESRGCSLMTAAGIPIPQSAIRNPHSV
jgi:hypothetical protein